MFEALQTLQLRLLHVDFVGLDHHWQYDKIISPFSRLYLITGGEGWVFHNHKKYELKPGNLYLIPAYTYSRYHCDTFLEQYYIHFLDQMEGGLSVYETMQINYENAAEELDYHLCAKLLALNPKRTVADLNPQQYDNKPELLSFNLFHTSQSLSNYGQTQGILLQLFSRFLGDEATPGTRASKSFHQLTGALQFIHQHLHEKITIEQLASILHLQVDYFSRLFLEVVGVRPMEYIQNKRLERAQLLLTTSGASLKEIAQRVGIPNIYYFSRLFRRRYTMPPGEYRKVKWQV
jgi:AraC-like DNA-binding protein